MAHLFASHDVTLRDEQRAEEIGCLLPYRALGQVRNQDAANQLIIALRIDQNRDQAWKFIQSHWDKVQAQLTPEIGADLVTSAGSFCSASGRDSVASFFSTHKVAAADAALKHAIEGIDGCIELRTQQEPELKTWLTSQPKT